MTETYECEICETPIDHEGFCDRCYEIFGPSRKPSTCKCLRCGGESDIPGGLCADCDAHIDARPESRW